MKRGKKPTTTEDNENKRENTQFKSERSAKHSRSTERGSPTATAASVVARNRELEDILRRTLADYQNLERRIEDERRELSKLSSLLLVEKLLPILDNLENAQAHLKDRGLQIVIKQFKDLLASEGVEEIVAENAQFDPHFHEAVEIVSGPQDNKIVSVVNKGYMVDNKVIRPAKVVVQRKADSGQALRQDSGQARMTEDQEIADSFDKQSFSSNNTQEEQVENDAIGGENV